MNIKCRKVGLAPSVVVCVATVRAMKMNGGVAKADLSTENVAAVRAGCPNLGRHIENLKSFGVPVIVAINHFVNDTDSEVQAVKDFVKEQGAEAIVSRHWELGSKGALNLAKRVADISDAKLANFVPSYPDNIALMEKIEVICKQIYRANEVVADKVIRDQLKAWEEQGYGHFPVCMAKTQYSFSTDPNLRGAPTGHSIPVREVRLSAGAGFIVAVCGQIMTMPGLPRIPAAETIRLSDEGQVEGLF
jgi:formate--tetrahydrofolate ligase